MRTDPPDFACIAAELQRELAAANARIIAANEREATYMRALASAHSHIADLELEAAQPKPYRLELEEANARIKELERAADDLSDALEYIVEGSKKQWMQGDWLSYYDRAKAALVKWRGAK